MAQEHVHPHGVAGPALIERRARLEPEPASPGAARRLLREVLDAAGHSEWTDAGELAVSELVTNAALHAHTEIDLRLEVFEDRLCVEVRDFDPTLPVPRDYDDHATTGRGMGLVATLALDCGVHSLGEDGKITWFCIGGDEGGDGGEDAGWDLDAWPDTPAELLEDQETVVLEDLPLTLWMSARQHHDALLRELVLYMAAHPEIDADVASTDRARAMISGPVAAIVDEAQREGRAHPVLPAGHPTPLPWVPDDMAVELCVPPDAGAMFATMQDTLDLAESLAVKGELFARPGLPEIIAARDWACDQVIAQLAGSPPAPWPGAAQDRFEVEVHDRVTPAAPVWDAALVTTSSRAAVAADDANRIIAVSAAFAELVGWSAEELVGRRIVTVVPPQFREAHVAGFSRHLSTGESHILGVPLEVPVLRSDGSEIQCRLLVEQTPAQHGRSVYVAWITPIAP